MNRKLRFSAVLAIMFCVIVTLVKVDGECLAADDEERAKLVKADSVAYSLLRAGKYEKAEKDFKAIIKQDKQFIRSYWGLAAIYCYTGKFGKMLDIAGISLENVELERSKFSASLLNAVVQYQIGNLEKAEKHLAMSLEFAKKANNPAIIRNALNWEHMFWRDIGEIKKSDKKIQEYAEFLKSANLSAEQKIAYETDILWNQANNAILRGDLEKAKDIKKQYLALELDEDPEERTNYKKLKIAIAFGEERYKDVIEYYKNSTALLGAKRQADAYEKMGNMEKVKDLWTTILNWNGRGLTSLIMHKQAKLKLAELAEEETIIKVMRSYEIAINDYDTNQIVSSWAHERYAASITAWNEYRMGWETIHKNIKLNAKFLEQNPENKINLTINVDQIDIHKNTAHVFSTWLMAGEQLGERFKGNLTVYTILEKYNGLWKIVLQARPESKFENLDRPNYEETETGLNALGYKLLGKKNYSKAIEVFKLNVKLYPKSFNVYDSLAEAYMENGDIDLAIKNYKKSLELNPKNKNAKDKIKEMEKKN